MTNWQAPEVLDFSGGLNNVFQGVEDQVQNFQQMQPVVQQDQSNFAPEPLNFDPLATLGGSYNTPYTDPYASLTADENGGGVDWMGVLGAPREYVAKPALGILSGSLNQERDILGYDPDGSPIYGRAPGGFGDVASAFRTALTQNPLDTYQQSRQAQTEREAKLAQDSGVLSGIYQGVTDPLNIVGAAAGPKVGLALRRAGLGLVAPLVEPVVSGGFGQRLAGEALVSAGFMGGSALANEYLPENMPFRNAAVMGTGLLTGGATVGAGNLAGLKAYQPSAGVIDNAMPPRVPGEVANAFPSPAALTPSQQGLATDLTPSLGATEDFGAGIPYWRSTPDPAQKLTEAVNAFTPGEKPATGLLRQYDGAVKTAGLEMVEDWDNGTKVLQSLGLAKRTAGQVVVKRSDEMEALFKALHGEGPVPPRLQSVYDDIKRLVDLEAKSTEDFDPNFIMREDYFYRGWRAPKETNAGAGGFGAKPGYAKPRTDATFSALLADGWEPVSWNPYDMLALRRMAGVTYREQKTMVTRMLDLEVAIKVDGPVPDGFRIPRIGPAFEGKPFAYTASAKATDAAGRLADEGASARLGITDKIAVPDGVANVLEEMFGTRGKDWKILGNVVNVSKAWRGATGGLKRIKLFGSFFQQMDFATRQSGSTFGGVIDDVLHGKPLSAIRKTVAVPTDIGKLAWANTSSGRRAALRRQILSEAPIITDRPGLTLKAIAEQGWNTQDITILNRNAVRDMVEGALKEPPSGFKGSLTYPTRKVAQIDRAMQNGLFDGVYPQAQITALKNFVVPRLARQHPDWSDARIAASAATEINKLFSTLGPWQTGLAGAPKGVKNLLHGVIFSTNETESLVRQAFSTVTGPNKQMWITYYAGGALFLGLVANAIHFAATGEPLPFDRYQPFEKDDRSPFGYKYNGQFLAPEVPILNGRGGFPIDLDLMGQMDTIFRMLDPKAFTNARWSVIMRAGLNQWEGEDFFGRKLDTPQERLGQLGSDLGLPIGAGQVLGAAGQGVEGEQRLGTAAQLLQGAGGNFRARSNAALRDSAAQEKYGRSWDKLEPNERNDLLKANPALKEELGKRRDEGVSNDQPWAISQAAMEEIKQDRLKDEAAAVAQLTASGDAKGFRDMVSNIQSEAAARSKQARIDAGWDPRKPANADEKALADYYDAFDTARLPGGSVDFDVLDREMARLEATWTPEQEAYIDRNTGLAEHAPGVQQLYDAREKIGNSGYWDLRDTAWTELNSQYQAPGYQPGQTFNDYKKVIIAEAIAAGVPSYDAEETAMARHPVLSRFNDLYKQGYLYPWADSHPEETQLLVQWDYLDPDAAMERYLQSLGMK